MRTQLNGRWIESINVVNSSLLEFFPDPFLINVLDVGAALLEKPPYQGLIDAKRCRVIGFEPNPEECQRLNQVFGAPHRFFPYCIGDGKPATGGNGQGTGIGIGSAACGFAPG